MARELLHASAADLMSHPEQAALRSLGTVYADVPQRWVVVYSPEAYQRALHTVNRHCLRRSRRDYKAFEPLCKQDFACEADARKALGAFEKTLEMSFVAEAQVRAQVRSPSQGRPARDRAPDFHLYRINLPIIARMQTLVLNKLFFYNS